MSIFALYAVIAVCIAAYNAFKVHATEKTKRLIAEQEATCSTSCVCRS